MRRTVIVGLFVLAFLVGPVARVEGRTAPAPEPSPAVTIGR